MSLNSPSNIAFYYNDLWKTKPISASSQHYNFPAENSQKKWLTKSWQSSHGTGSGGGMFKIGDIRLYFTDTVPAITSIISSGTYTAESLATEIGSQMTIDSLLPQTYTCTYDMKTYKFTISASSNFTLWCNTYTSKAIWDTIGFSTTSDLSGSNSYTSDYIRIHTEEWIKIGDGYPIPFTGLFVLNHNVQSSGTLQWQFSNSNFGNIDLSFTASRYGNISATLYDALQSTYAYIRIRIVDIDNPDGFVKIGRAWISDVFLPKYGFAPGMQEIQTDLSKIKMSQGVESSSIILPQIKNVRLNFDFGEKWKEFTGTIKTFLDMFDSVGNTLPLIAVQRELVPDSNTFLNSERYTLYCRIKSWKSKQIAGEIRSVNLSLTEEK